MSKLDELIQELCPDGVEYKPLSDKTLFAFRYGKGNKIPEDTGGQYDVYGANGIVSHIDEYNCEDVTIIGHIGAVGLINRVKGKCFVTYNGTIATVVDKEKVDSQYLYYVLTTLDLPSRKKGSQPFLSVSDFDKIAIPVPPLEVQREIVRILDSFTLLTAELTAELTARKKQYEYYRDALLKFDNDMQMVKLSELCKITRGIRVTRSELNGDSGYPVYQNSLTPMGYYNKPNRKANTSFIISAGAAGEIGYSTEDYWAADDCLTFECTSSLNDRFLYHFFKTKQEYLYSRVRKASIPRLSREVLEKLEIPLLPIEIQNRLVSVLDNFDAICSDLNIGLPAEIEAREKQYEFYRDKLLTFKQL